MTRSSLTPLCYPAHYPPRQRWARFFIGVRWLGPDLSFFSVLKSLQGERTGDQMEAWGGGNRQRIATVVGEAFARQLRWPSPWFLPEDEMRAIAGGPRFVGLDDQQDMENAVGEIQERLGVALPRGYWEDAGARTLAEVVDQIVSEAAGSGLADPADFSAAD
ncbi:hypothetical protein [Stenotrophomonas sp.]|uniref:hypothetical protein n=1 Tax=Stenotrophomonas sp. TaxID=69392 RepID=UPI0028ACBA19|nr:hypothetical protein [Stenotrophomonas sp.]